RAVVRGMDRIVGPIGQAIDGGPGRNVVLLPHGSLPSDGLLCTGSKIHAASRPAVACCLLPESSAEMPASQARRRNPWTRRRARARELPLRPRAIVETCSGAALPRSGL